MITVSEASELFHISKARIRKLVQEGRIAAERDGKRWLVDEASLARHLETASVGRPAREDVAVRSSKRIGHYTLMNRTFEVARCSYDPHAECFTTFQMIDPARAPLALHTYQVDQMGLRKAFNSWWGSRAVPNERDLMQMRLRELRLRSTFSLPLRSMGLSLSDQYWLRPEHSDATWEDVNYFRNSFDLGPVDAEGSPLASSSEWTNSVGLHSPDNTTDGMIRKRWIIDGEGRRVLIKGNAESGREVYNEVVATMLYRRLLPASRYVEYRLASWRGHDVCACETFLRDDEEFIPAWYVYKLKKRSNNHNAYRHYCETCADLGIWDAPRQLDRMIVCDTILANVDRHWGNFGIIRNVNTLEYRAAPIFDTGSSLWSDRSIREIAAGNYSFKVRPFYPDPLRQLKLVDDASWYHEEALEGFVDEVHDFLSGALMAEQANVICKGLARQVDTANGWARQAPTSKFSPEEIGSPEDIILVWL